MLPSLTPNEAGHVFTFMGAANGIFWSCEATGLFRLRKPPSTNNEAL